jgi:uncharacterized membrane protein YdbT with pleckstrin-like domain
MLYVQQSLSPDEEIIHIGHFHWMYTVKAVLAIVWGIVGCIAVILGALYFQEHYWIGFQSEGVLARIKELHPGIRIGAFFVFIFGVLRFASMMVVKATTEIAITNSRLIFKRGLVARYVGEMSIDRIEGVNVLQTVLGRIFGYGRIMVRGMGVGEVVLPPISNPIAFRRAIEKARTL